MVEDPFRKIEDQNKQEATPRSEKGGKLTRKTAINQEMARRVAAKEVGEVRETGKRKEIKRVLEENDLKVLIKDVLDAASVEEALEVLRIYAEDADIHVTPEILHKVAMERINSVKTDEEREEIMRVFVDAGIVSPEVKTTVTADPSVAEESREADQELPPLTEEQLLPHKKRFEDSVQWLKRGLYPAPAEKVEDITEMEVKKDTAVPEEAEVDIEERIAEALSRKEPLELKTTRKAIFDVAYGIYGETLETLNEILEISGAEDHKRALVEAFLTEKLDLDDREMASLVILEDPRAELFAYALKLYKQWEEVVEIGIESESPREVIVEKISQGVIPQKEGEYILNEITARAVADAINAVELGITKGPLTLYWEERMLERQLARTRMAEQAEAAFRFYKDQGRRNRRKKKQPGEEADLGRQTRISKRLIQQKIAKSLEETAEKEVEETAARKFLYELKSDPEKMREFEEGQPHGKVEEIKYQIRLLEAEEKWKKEVGKRREELGSGMELKKDAIGKVWEAEGLQAELQGLTKLPIEEFTIPQGIYSKLQKLFVLQREYQNLARQLNSIENTAPEKPKRIVLKKEVEPYRVQGVRIASPQEEGEIEYSALRDRELNLIAAVREKIKNDRELIVDITAEDETKVKNVLQEIDYLTARINKNPLPESSLWRDLKVLERRAKLAMGLITEEKIAKHLEDLTRKGTLTTLAKISGETAPPAAKKEKKKGKKKDQEESANRGKGPKGRSK